MKNPNINIVFDKERGENIYVTASTDDLVMPSLLFGKQEHAELAVAIAKAMQVDDQDMVYMELPKVLPFIFRMLKLKSNWSN